MQVPRALQDERHDGNALLRAGRRLIVQGRAGPHRLPLLILVGALALIGATPAAAHDGSIAIDCETVTFAFSGFPSGNTPVDYVIQVDGATTASGTLGIVGPSATQTIANHIAGDHAVSASASWTVDGGGTAQQSGAVTCPLPTSTAFATAASVAPAPVAAPVPASAPVPPAPEALPAPVAAPVPAPAPVPPAPAALPPPLPVAPLSTPADDQRAAPMPWTATPQPPRSRPRTCGDTSVAVAAACGAKAGKKHLSAPPVSPKPAKHVGVLASKKTKNLPFTL